MRKFFSGLLLTIVCALPGVSASAANNIPAGIQEGNILHCFNWKISDIIAELPAIANAGFGSIQISPVQRNVQNGWNWSDAYRPYDFKFAASAIGTAADLENLCEKAGEYGIKIIVDVVANHVDGSSYHDPWWNNGGRLRSNGGINYGDRNSITHGQLGDYPDVNSENADVQQRAKAYVEELKSMGVKGIRWDAAKHIGLPSENCAFWSTVTSVPGMYHYGEILDNPGGDANRLMKEYTDYMCVTDNGYGDGARNNDGVPGSFAGWGQGTIQQSKLVYWGESHDTYSNSDGASKNISQAQVDRAYAIVACRKSEAALYLSRPSARAFGDIKFAVKGSTHFTSKEVAEVNKFRNAMVGKNDYFSQSNGVASVTRQNGGAVIVKRGGGGNVSVANGGGFCPAGTYTDRVSGGKFTVTATTISGNVGASGIAVIYNDGTNPDPDPNPDPTPDPTPDPSARYIYFENTSNWTPYVWAWNDAEPSVTANAAWPGDAMTLKNGKYYWEAPADKVPTMLIISNNGGEKAGGGDLEFVNGATYRPDGTYTVEVNPNPNPNPNPDPVPDPSDFTIYYDNSVTNWSNVNIHYWNSPTTKWPGVAMTKVEDNVWKYTFDTTPSSLVGFLFCDGSGSGDANQTADYKGVPVNRHIYKGAGGGKGKVTDEGEYAGGDDPTPAKPVVKADPAPGRFTDEVTVTLTVNPAAKIHYTIDGTAPSTSSRVYSEPLTFAETTTLRTLAVTDEGAVNSQSFTYTKRGPVVDPVGNSLVTDYYKVNPDGQVGTNKTIDMKFTKVTNDNRMCVADNALSNWTEKELIAQGVARDVASAIRGKHEYPVVDSYAVYAAYDADNLYLGVQYVYTVWDLYGDGKITNGATKPYNMDGRLMLAFDLDPELSMEGVLVNGSTVWDEGGKFNTFNNGTDCIWLGSTKSTVGQPGLFFPNADGKIDYNDPAGNVALAAPFYGCADGLLPSITHIWGQKEFGYDPEDLKTNDGFVDLIDEVPADCHTFYEFRFPLSKLGITESYIKNTGIGVMVIDTYGQGAIGSTPYDPTCFDNADQPYSKDKSTSAEKEDTDVFTYAHARIGKLRNQSAVDNIIIDPAGEGDVAPVYYNLQGIEIKTPSAGIYIERRGDKVRKVVVR